MTAPQNPRVTQADREAALKAAGFNSEDDLTAWGSSANRAEVAVLAQAFACHREAAEAASKAREAALVTLLHGVGGLLETNVRTKARDDHAEQKMIVLIRKTLTAKEPDA